MRLAALALLTLAPLALSASAQSSPFRPVPMPALTIALQNYSYSPNPIVLQAGQPVRLQFVNRSAKGHDFTAREFFATSRIVEGREHVSGGEIEVGPGQSVTVMLIPARGAYRAHCGHPFHKMLGMTANIVVR